MHSDFDNEVYWIGQKTRLNLRYVNTLFFMDEYTLDIQACS